MRPVLRLLPVCLLFSSELQFVYLKRLIHRTGLETSAPPPNCLRSSAFEFQVLAQHLRRAILYFFFFSPNPGREQFGEISLHVSTLISPLPRFRPLLSFPPPCSPPAQSVREVVYKLRRSPAREARGPRGVRSAHRRRDLVGLRSHWLAAGSGALLLATALPVA